MTVSCLLSPVSVLRTGWSCGGVRLVLVSPLPNDQIILICLHSITAADENSSLDKAMLAMEIKLYEGFKFYHF